MECHFESDPDTFDSFVLRSFEAVREPTQVPQAKAVLIKPILNSQNPLELLGLHPDAERFGCFIRIQKS